MKCFLVIPIPDDKEAIAKHIEGKFESPYTLEGGYGWVVSDPKKDTANSVWEAIKTNPDGDEPLGALVVDVSIRGGYYYRGLWETLNNWEGKK